MGDVDIYRMPEDDSTAYLEPTFARGASIDWHRALADVPDRREPTEYQRLKAGLMFFTSVAAAAEEILEWRVMAEAGYVE